jgi:hypothetical protein
MPFSTAHPATEFSASTPAESISTIFDRFITKS